MNIILTTIIFLACSPSEEEGKSQQPIEVQKESQKRNQKRKTPRKRILSFRTPKKMIQTKQKILAVGVQQEQPQNKINIKI